MTWIWIALIIESILVWQWLWTLEKRIEKVCLAIGELIAVSDHQKREIDDLENVVFKGDAKMEFEIKKQIADLESGISELDLQIESLKDEILLLHTEMETKIEERADQRAEEKIIERLDRIFDGGK